MAKRSKRPPVAPQEEPYAIAMYREWAEHRYDPGYYLGGRIPPYLRRSPANRRGRRNYSWFLVLSGVATWFAMPGYRTDPLAGLAITLIFLLGLLQIVAAWRLRKPARRSPR